jgi:hypothetical protein
VIFDLKDPQKRAHILKTAILSLFLSMALDSDIGPCGPHSKMLFEASGRSIPMKSATAPSAGRFRRHEDLALQDAVRRLRASSWEAIAAHVPTRTAQQCRERWTHHLSVRPTDSPWTPAEDDLLWDKVAEIGPKWGRIARILQGRSDYQAKARWMMLFRARRLSCFRSGCQRYQFTTHKSRSEVAQTVKPDMTQAEAELLEGASIWDRLEVHLEQQWRDEDSWVLASGQWW